MHFEKLERLDLGDIDGIELPPASLALIDDAGGRVERFQRAGAPIPAFAAGNAWIAGKLLRRIIADGLANGARFCEWGSGFGIVACVARQLGLQATAIEIEAALVAESRRLAADHGLELRIVEGSYRPAGTAEETVERERIDAALGFSPVDFDIIYVYPWAAEERLVSYLFCGFAPAGALLVLYRGGCRYEVLRHPGAT